MEEKEISFPSEDVVIEGRLLTPGGADGAKGHVIVCHPHPEFGGNLNNNVVRTVAEALCAGGFRVLTFNFRGVGKSGGSYGEGIGEQDDVEGAVNFLVKDGARHVYLVGYSFGAWVGLWASVGDDRVKAVVGIAPPVMLYSFDFFSGYTSPKLLIAGSEDQFCPRDKVTALFDTLPEPRSLEIIPGADHFFYGQEELLSAKVLSFLTALP